MPQDPDFYSGFMPLALQPVPGAAEPPGLDDLAALWAAVRSCSGLASITLENYCRRSTVLGCIAASCNLAALQELRIGAEVLWASPNQASPPPSKSDMGAPPAAVGVSGKVARPGCVAGGENVALGGVERLGVEGLLERWATAAAGRGAGPSAPRHLALQLEPWHCETLAAEWRVQGQALQARFPGVRIDFPAACPAPCKD